MRQKDTHKNHFLKNILLVFIFWSLIALRLAVAASPVTQETLDKIKTKCAEAYSQELLIKFVADQALKTEKGAFAASSLEALVDPFTSFLKPNLKFIDLGSGDGRVVFFASLFGVDATGIEFDPDLYQISLNAMKNLSDIVDPQRIQFIKGDFFQHDFSNFDIFYSFGTDTQSGFTKKLLKEMNPGSILILNGIEETTVPDGLNLIKIFSDTDGDNDIAVYKRM